MPQKVIQLSEYQASGQYNEIITELRAKLGDLASELFDQCINLATSGKWKKWSDEQPVGSQVCFDVKMLREAGDQNIKMLLDLSEYIGDLNKRLKLKPGAQAKLDTILSNVKSLVDQLDNSKKGKPESPLMKLE